MIEPFHIATITVGDAGRVGISRLPGLGGMLDDDIDALTGWRPDIVVSMTTLQEMTAAGAVGLGPRLEAEGIAWAHFPIVDYGGPEDESSALWPSLSDQIHSCIDRGGAVLFHCRGGRGRSGMMALRVLVERGEDARQALARIRLVRPGAVETDEQISWASGLAVHIR